MNDLHTTQTQIKSFIQPGPEANDLAAMLECQAFAIEDLIKKTDVHNKPSLIGTGILTSVKVAANLVEAQ